MAVFISMCKVHEKSDVATQSVWFYPVAICVNQVGKQYQRFILNLLELTSDEASHENSILYSHVLQ